MKTPIFEEHDNMDEAGCLNIYEGSYDFYIAVLESFVNSGQKDANKLRQYMQDDNREKYRIVMHGLKSSAASVGATELANLANAMDDMYKKGEWQEVVKLHDKLVDTLANVVDLIKTRLDL